MKRAFRIPLIALLSLLASLFISLPALAVPQLPASFYGKAKVNGSNVPDGTSIQALIDGQVYGETVSQTYEGDSVYALNVSGDDSDTTAKDGGREGDTIQFKIGGVLATQTGTWHSGTNVNLDLAVSSSEPIATPAPTSIPVPTQTAIVLVPTALPATATQSNQAAATTVPPARITTEQTGPSVKSTLQPQAVQATAAPEASGEKGSGSTAAVVVSVAIGIGAILTGYYFLVMRKKNL
jgi:hypothetical protein